MSYAKGLLLGSFSDVDIDAFIERIKKDKRLTALTVDQKSLLRMVIIGIEHLNEQEVRDALNTQFNDIDGLCRYLMDYKPKFSDLQRKHVCLLVDKVKFLINFCFDVKFLNRL